MNSTHKWARGAAVLGLLGAAEILYAGGGRLYPGNPRPANETAMLVCLGEFWIDSVKPEGGDEKHLKLISSLRLKVAAVNTSINVVEVLPGHYDLCMASRDAPGLYAHVTKHCGVGVDALAGHVSYIEMVPGGHDSPSVPAARDVPARDAEDESRERINMNMLMRKAVEKYLQGSRPAMTEDGNGNWK